VSAVLRIELSAIVTPSRAPRVRVSIDMPAPTPITYGDEALGKVIVFRWTTTSRKMAKVISERIPPPYARDVKFATLPSTIEAVRFR
jgi:hypothetical protein